MQGRPTISPFCPGSAVAYNRLFMAIDKPYLDIPGTTVFDADQSRKGYWLNQFCMSLMRALEDWS